MFDRVIIGVDGRQGGHDAITLARRLAAPGATVTFAHVYSLPTAAGRAGGLALPLQLEAAERVVGGEAMRSGLMAEPNAIYGESVARGLHQVAEERRADLVILGSGNRSLLGRTLLGDGTRDALNGAPVVRPWSEDEGRPQIAQRAAHVHGRAIVKATPREPARVLIAGGGVAAIEALLALRDLAGRSVDITVVSTDRAFVYRPVTVAEAFERGEARVYPLGEITNYADAQLIWDSIERVDAAKHSVLTAAGDEITYDHLVMATGAIADGPLPGALTFRGSQDVPALKDLLNELVSGRAESVALTTPSERMWTLPIYELALMIGAHLRERGSEATVWLVTPEEEPLELFGPAASSAISPMLRARGVRLQTSSRASSVRRRALELMGGAVLHVDRVVTLPELRGPSLPGLPHDRHGFIPVDMHGRVRGLADVYAAGDATSFPLKQGGLATQQADAVAETIAAATGAPLIPKPFRPVLRGLLLTGGAPLYLRSEPQRLPREATVAIEARSARRSSANASAAAGQPLWWPPAKIAGRYLAPYLATARPQPLRSELLADRAPAPGPPVVDSETDDALELALLLADCDARWGDYSAALSALEAAEAIHGALPPEYEHKRRDWRAAERVV